MQNRHRLIQIDPTRIVIKDDTGDLVHLFKLGAVDTSAPAHPEMDIVAVRSLMPNKSAITAMCTAALPAVYVLDIHEAEEAVWKKPACDIVVLPTADRYEDLGLYGSAIVLVRTDVKWYRAFAGAGVSDTRAMRFLVARMEEIQTIHGVEFVNPFAFKFVTDRGNLDASGDDLLPRLRTELTMALNDASEFKFRMDTAEVAR